VGDFPDPRPPMDVTRTAMGSWVVIKASDQVIRGELIAVDRRQVYVLVSDLPGAAVWRAAKLVKVPSAAIISATVYPYEVDSYTAWGLTGTLITGPLFILGIPEIWLLLTAIGNADQENHARMSYPGIPLLTLATWARFPQGLPASIKPGDLIGAPVSNPGQRPPLASPLVSPPADSSGSPPAPPANPDLARPQAPAGAPSAPSPVVPPPLAPR
jgi:hypothetical protein